MAEVPGRRLQRLDISASTVVPIGTGAPELLVNIPNEGRVVRVILRSTCFGLAAFAPNSTVEKIGAAYVFSTLYVQGGVYNPTIIRQDNRALRLEVTALFDSLGGLNNQRFWTAWHYGGDLELGFNQRMSYGGTGVFGMSILLQSGISYINTGPPSFSLRLDQSMSVFVEP